MADRRDKASYALVGGGGALALTPAAANKTKVRLVRRQMDRSIGTLGGLDHEGQPVRPLDLSGRRGGYPGDRRPSPRGAAGIRYQEAAKPFLERLNKPAVGVRAGNAMKLGGLSLAVTGALASSHGRREVTKAVREWPDVEVSPQYGVGIPETRTNPISPLAMSASSGIMADFLIGASGRRISRRKKKAIRRGAYGFAGAQGMLYSPLGFGRSNAS